MAVFTKWVDDPTKRRYRRLHGPPTYQDWVDDAGNYNSGKAGVGPLIGTNRSIAAFTLSAWRGYPVTKEEMMALSLEEAKAIYKAKFWDKIQGDKMDSQTVAELTGDLRSHTGNSMILQRALNNLGANLKVDGGVGNATITALNDLLKRKGEKAVYEQMRAEAIKFYTELKNRTTGNVERNRKTGEAGIKHLNEDYPPYDQLAANRKDESGNSNKKRLWLFILIMVLLVLIAGYIYIYRNRN